jgi:hypothetical protein
VQDESGGAVIHKVLPYDKGKTKGIDPPIKTIPSTA